MKAHRERPDRLFTIVGMPRVKESNDEQHDTAVHWRIVEFALLPMITIVAVGLRLPQLSESLWVDELHMAWTVADGVQQVAPRAAMGNQSPLYFYFAWLSVQIFGMNEVAVRLPSLIAGTAIVPLVYIAVRHWTGSRAAALLAAVLCMVDLNFLFYSAEARPYVFVQLVGLAQAVVFWRLVNRPSWIWRLVFIPLSALLFYVHYTAILLVAAEVAFYLTCCYRPRWALAHHWRPFFADVFLIGVIGLPALPHLAFIAGRRGNWRLVVDRVTPLDLFGIFPWDVYVLLPAAMLATVAAIRWRLGKRPLTRAMDGRLLAFAFAWAAVPALLSWFTSYLDVARLFLLRYVVAAIMGLVVFAAACCAMSYGRHVRVLSTVIVAAAAMFFAGPIGSYRTTQQWLPRRGEDWRGAVQYINSSQAADGLPVFIYSGLIEADELIVSDDPAIREYCLLPVTSMYRLDTTHQQLIPLPFTQTFWQEEIDDELGAIVNAGGALLIARAELNDFAGILESTLRIDELESYAVEVAEKKSFGNVWVTRFRVYEEEATASESRRTETSDTRE